VEYPETAALLAKYRINPGNVGAKRHDEHFRTIVKVAIDNGKPVRIGVNWGSLDQQLLTHLMDANARSAEPRDARDVMILLRGSVRPSMVEALRRCKEAGLKTAMLTNNFVTEEDAPRAHEVIELFDVVHSLDRLDLAKELDKRARARGRTVAALVEVNLAGEASKGGVSPDGLGALLDAVAAMSAVSVRGLMAIPPEVERPEDSRRWFRGLREQAERRGLKRLSMGMSSDFEVAVEEGATMVRVGTAIFGARA